VAEKQVEADKGGKKGQKEKTGKDTRPHKNPKKDSSVGAQELNKR
jgi:hypothetical protein